MKYVKILGLLAVAAAALMAFAASASATTITSATNEPYTGTIAATSEGHVKLENPIAKIECSSHVHGLALTHGTGVTAEGNINELLWGEKEGVYGGKCTNAWHVTTVLNGSLQIHWKAEHEGTLTSSKTKVDTTRLGVTCVYETNNTTIGTLTDSHKAGGATTTATQPATLDIEATIPINEAESSALCGTGNAKWEGSYVVKTPARLYIDP